MGTDAVPHQRRVRPVWTPVPVYVIMASRGRPVSYSVLVDVGRIVVRVYVRWTPPAPRCASVPGTLSTTAPPVGMDMGWRTAVGYAQSPLSVVSVTVTARAFAPPPPVGVTRDSAAKRVMSHALPPLLACRAVGRVHVTWRWSLAFELVYVPVTPVGRPPRSLPRVWSVRRSMLAAKKLTAPSPARRTPWGASAAGRRTTAGTARVSVRRRVEAHVI